MSGLTLNLIRLTHRQFIGSTTHRDEFKFTRLREYRALLPRYRRSYEG